eukprot:gene9678-11879_t
MAQKQIDALAEQRICPPAGRAQRAVGTAGLGGAAVFEFERECFVCARDAIPRVDGNFGEERAGQVDVSGPGELRLRVAAAALNFADLLMREGKYQEKPPLPYTPGMEVAGVVEALGPGVSGPPPGTRVLAFLNHGALAEAAIAPANRIVAIPDAMSFAEAAAFPIAYGTSHLALDHKARLQPGETLLVLGASGGVGLTAVEIGKRMGARVVASARGAEKLAIARAAG